jgi:hypothetical protein
VADADATAVERLPATLQAGPLDEWRYARLERLRGEIEFGSRRGRGASALLLEAAEPLEPLNAGWAGTARRSDRALQCPTDLAS